MAHLGMSTDKIIDECRHQFINIMPNYMSPHSEKVKPVEAIYRKQQIKHVMKNLSTLIQLTIQNCVLTSDPRTRSDSYRIIVNLRNLLSRDFGQFQAMISHQKKGKLPEYQVDCKQFLNRDVTLNIPPQISLYQDPLLFYNYSKVVQEELLCTHSKQVTRNEKIQLIKKHVPFLDPLYMPLIAERLESKAKFSEFEDRAILLLLKSQGKRQLSKLKSIYFDKRQEQQIKNRIKNLYAKQYDNAVKQWRRSQFMPLNEQEIKKVVLAYKRYGPRWAVISKYYQIRSADLIQADYESCPKLLKRRLKQNQLPSYGCIKLEIDKFLQKEIINDDDSNSESVIQSKSPLMKEEDISKYKIINHLTYLYEEI